MITKTEPGHCRKKQCGWFPQCLLLHCGFPVPDRSVLAHSCSADRQFTKPNSGEIRPVLNMCDKKKTVCLKDNDVSLSRD